MRRIPGPGQGGFAPKEPYDERKKSRESVISNFIIFASFVGLIRAIPILLKNAS